MSDETIEEIIARKRAAGYDAKFEALLARKWRCPHCQHETTILKVVLPLGEPDRDPLCPACEQEGIEPVDPRPEMTVIAGGAV
jgi:hypothetical protein